ncbi:MAG: SPFH domain-containing protein [Planctomycetota bacterium]
MPDLFGLSTEVLYLVFAAVMAVVKATNVTVRSGMTGLKFTLGRVSPRPPLGPGLHFLVPFVQRVRQVPTRSRTLDLPAQRVATHEGYVYVADANLVFRITDVERALIQVDDLLSAMERMLTLGVQEVLREATFQEIKALEGLDEALHANLEEKLEPWGVTVERVGFPSISPSKRTVRITQLQEGVLERARQHRVLRSAAAGAERGAAGASRPLGPSSALGAIGTRRVFRTKARARRPAARALRRSLRLRAALERMGFGGSEIARVRARLTGRRR